jgi:hypothetical protein
VSGDLPEMSRGTLQTGHRSGPSLFCEKARTMRTLDDLKAQLGQNPEFVEEYEALEPEHQVVWAVLGLRLQRGFPRRSWRRGRGRSRPAPPAWSGRRPCPR